MQRVDDYLIKVQGAESGIGASKVKSAEPIPVKDNFLLVAQ